MFTDEFREQVVQQFDTLPARLGGHIGLSLAALLIGILISIPLGIWAAKRQRVEHVAMTLASIIQTIPSLALLAVMVFLFQTIGWIPAWLALVLYSVLPMLRGTITGLQGIDPACIEAADGIGMDERQKLLKVQLPLAMPSIVGGIRTASVWVVGAATLAQPVGATSLGNYIFVGLQTSNFAAMLFGCFFSALLAIVFDSLFRCYEVAADRRNARLAYAVTLGFLLIGCSPFLLSMFSSGNIPFVDLAPDAADVAEQRPIVIGSKAFTEQYILTKLFQAKLEEAGVQSEQRDGMGSAMVFNALAAGDIDCYVDYTGTIWSNYMKRSDTTSPAEMLIDVSTFLKQEKKILCLGSLGFSNDYAFAMRRQHAEELGIRDLNDLAQHAGELSAATDIEFFDRPEWSDVRKRYGFDFRERITMDATLMYGAIANEKTDVIIAFNTDARLDAYDLIVLDDPRFALPPYDAVLLVSEKAARQRNAMRVLRSFINTISSAEMRSANGLVDIEKKSPTDAAMWLIERL